MKIFFTLMPILFFLIGCQTNQYKSPKYTASQDQINNYFLNMKIKPQGGSYFHKEHGTIKAIEEPYLSDFNECLVNSFNGKSFSFGSLEVNDPHRLHQFTIERSLHSIRSSFEASKGLPSNKATIFDDETIKHLHFTELNDISKKQMACIKNKGWSYVRN